MRSLWRAADRSRAVGICRCTPSAPRVEMRTLQLLVFSYNRRTEAAATCVSTALDRLCAGPTYLRIGQTALHKQKDRREAVSPKSDQLFLVTCGRGCFLFPVPSAKPQHSEYCDGVSIFPLR